MTREEVREAVFDVLAELLEAHRPRKPTSKQQRPDFVLITDLDRARARQLLRSLGIPLRVEESK